MSVEITRHAPDTGGMDLASLEAEYEALVQAMMADHGTLGDPDSDDNMDIVEQYRVELDTVRYAIAARQTG